jgi:hypothetical protein
MAYRAAIVLAAWTTTATTAIIAGLAAISVLGAGITDRTVKPMTSAQVREALAQPAPAAPTPKPTAAATPRRRHHPKAVVPHRIAPPSVTRSLNSPGGSVLARCEASTVYLVSWTPQQGFGANNARRGPAFQTSVEFESAGREFTMVVSCRAGRPVADVRTESYRRHEERSDDH